MSNQQRPAIEVRDVSRNYRGATALDAVSVTFEKDMIHGLLGRNGAGKTTLMSLITAQDWPSSGEITVFGQAPHENEQVLPQICFVALHNPGCSCSLNPPLSSRDRAM